MLLRQVELALLLKTRASVMLAQGPELGPLLGELLGETRCVFAIACIPIPYETPVTNLSV